MSHVGRTCRSLFTYCVLGIGCATTTAVGPPSQSAASEIAKVLEVPDASGQTLPLLVQYFVVPPHSSDELNAAALAVAKQMASGFDVAAVQHRILESVTVDYASYHDEKAPYSSPLKRAQLARLFLNTASDARTPVEDAKAFSRAGVLLLVLDPLTPQYSQAFRAVSDPTFVKRSGFTVDQGKTIKQMIDTRSQGFGHNYEPFFPCWRSVDHLRRVDASGRAAAVDQAIAELDKLFPTAVQSVWGQWNWANTAWTLVNYARVADDAGLVQKTSSFIQRYADRPELLDVAKHWFDQAKTMPGAPGRLNVEMVMKDGKLVEKE